MDEDDYGDFSDEDFINACSQASQVLPPLRRLPQSHLNKRPRVTDSDDEGGSGEDDEESAKQKKKKYKIHVGVGEVPAAKIVGATQADGHPDSSPYRIRGPIFRKPRPEAPKSAVAQRQNTIFDSFRPRPKTPPQIDDFSRELDGLPSDAFSSPEPANKEPILIGSSPLRPTQLHPPPRQRLVAPQNGLRQTTLFGGQAPVEVPASQARKVHNFIVDLPPEAPTHHELNEEALTKWVYPMNIGSIRDYQFSIVRNGLFNNLLVALPTGLGKTLIAATVMLNYFLWTKASQIVFVAPTKPLVAQQVEACFGVVGIPKSQTTMLTGEQAPPLRAEEWTDKRVFFMTPQTLENDLSTGIADPKKIVLLVVDEAHRATGNYSYVKVVKFLRRFNKSFRILALTATPGASVEAVQEVIDNLEVSKVEIRTEESIDIAQYVHTRSTEIITLDPSEEINLIKEHLSKALQPLVFKLCAQNGYYNKDPMSLTPYGMIQARKTWFSSGAGKSANFGLKGMMNALFTVLSGIAHGIKLLNFHGIGPFYSYMKDFQQGVEESNKPSKYRTEILESADFKKMMDYMRTWINRDGFVSHPKLTELSNTILNHFMDAGAGRLGEDMPPSATRVIVFSEFRDSAEEISRILNQHQPLVRASVFVGQADSKRSEGMNQAKQLETIQDFKKGKINVIVATSIGEEGLDIGEVDLIVCYDASASPIRMLQRMGRTGRKRAGKIVLLLMRGKEEDSFAKAKDNYEQMQKIISSGERFNFRHDLSVRIIPKSIKPEVDKRMIEIPIENTQNPGLPEPKRRATKKKMPPKKFRMPDGVETGFQSASRMSGNGTTLTDMGVSVKKIPKPKAVPKSELSPIVPLESVLLSQEDTRELVERFQNIAGNEIEEVGMPDLTAQPESQRILGPTSKVSHGKYTERFVNLAKTLARSQNPRDRFVKPYGDRPPSLGSLYIPILIEHGMEAAPPRSRPKKPAPKPRNPPKPKKALRANRRKNTHIMSDPGSGMEATPGATNRQEISGDDTEGEGDDLANSEEISDDSDDSGSLQDFVVHDGMSSSVGVPRGSILTRSSSPPSARQKKGARKRPLFVSTQDTSDDDDKFPDLQSLGKTPRSTIRAATQLGSDPAPVAFGGRRRKAPPIFEDDSDE
ncbi:hypothetical protein HYALB_00001343 [Hymenoscyphus albidus]|uniref:ATP-dependent DNA helicase n=1 Tax=Hymenoscyphus albidus TaxID=595503 RepID=A0A9N9LF43_9HELO|nr:hypothetical protein HYALB_00001343 [Hymenoscyphus albidus]